MSTPVPIITAVENAIVARLEKGLGKMVRQVSTYGGEFDDEGLSEVVRNFPAAWVTFGGIKKTLPFDTDRRKWKPLSTFVVMVGTRSVRSEAASRQGGPSTGEVGANLLIYAVRRLLTQQDLQLPISAFEPGSVRTLFNTRLNREAFAVFALEFHTAWIEQALPEHTFAQPVSAVDPNDPTSGIDALFATYAGQIDPETPDLNSVRMGIYLDPSKESGAPDAQAIANFHPSQD